VKGRKQCNNHRRISLLSLPRKVYAKCLEETFRGIIAPKLEDTQGDFRPGRGTADTLQGIFEYSEDVCSCFADLEKAYDRVSRGKL